MEASVRRVLPAALLGSVACAAIGAMLLAQLAGASHPRPQSATPIQVSLVTAYEECTAPNRTHGPPLAFRSCSPPVQTSHHLTVGTPDANSARAQSTGFFRFQVVGSPGPPSTADVLVKQSITDVRCKAATSSNVCTSSNAADGPDYSGELQSDASMRITDHNNSGSPGGGPDPGTVVDIPFPVNVPCANTSSTAIGGTCSIDTSMQAVRPGLPGSLSGKRSILALTQVHVRDGGQDGKVGTGPNTLFAVQGIFIP